LGQASTERRRDERIERVVLLGYMSAGKSTVGEALARRMEWRFLDFDVEIERREGASVGQIVEERGEDTLRAMEAALTREIEDETQIVVAPGGGWITHPELLDSIRAGTLSVWLRVSVEETVRRLREDPRERPFKEAEDPRPLVARMMEEREPLYRLADLTVPAGRRSAEEIAFEIELTLRFRGV
jgi:shikimate kinase